jgi:hypothetical protein
MAGMAEMYAGGAMNLVISESEIDSRLDLGYHSSLALEYAALWDERAINNELNLFPRGGRYIRVDNLIRGEDNLRTLILTEVGVHNSALTEIKAVSASMSSVFGDSNLDSAYQARNCFDGEIAASTPSKTCRTAVNDSNPWILIDYGNDKALDDVMVIQVSATIESGDPLQGYAIRAIQGARIAVTTDTTGDEVVWSSTFSGLASSFVFKNQQDSGLARAKLQKENECKALFKFCSDGDPYWPDTPSFEYFVGSEVTPATCDFALAKCYEDFGEDLSARLHFIKAGGLAVGSARNDLPRRQWPLVRCMSRSQVSRLFFPTQLQPSAHAAGTHRRWCWAGSRPSLGVFGATGTVLPKMALRCVQAGQPLGTDSATPVGTRAIP